MMGARDLNYLAVWYGTDSMTEDGFDPDVQSSVRKATLSQAVYTARANAENAGVAPGFWWVYKRVWRGTAAGYSWVPIEMGKDAAEIEA